MLRVAGLALIVAWIFFFARLLSEANKDESNEIPFAAVCTFIVSAVAWIFWSVVASLGWRGIHFPYILHIAVAACLVGSVSSVVSSILLFRKNDKLRLALTIVGFDFGGFHLLGVVRTIFMMLDRS